MATSTFFGISVAVSGLNAQRGAMDVLAYNVAHANDPTYKRQRPIFVEGHVLAQPQEANPLGISPFGAGVQSGGIQRVKEDLIEARLRLAMQEAANWQYQSNTMKQIEAMLSEPSNKGLQEDLDHFWASWNKIAVTPEDLPLRSGLLEDASAICQRMNYMYKQFLDIQDDLNLATEDRVSKINLITEEIGRLNNQIGALRSGMIPINDLLNRRDALVQELSKLIQITTHGEAADDFIISIGGRVLVQGLQVYSIKAEMEAGKRIVRWTDDNTNVQMTGGELRGITELRDAIIPEYLAKLDQVATQLRDNVNNIHRNDVGNPTFDRQGNPGLDFFEPGTTAANITVNALLLGHPERIAASADGSVGDGSVALRIANLKDTPVVGVSSINQLYRDFVGNVGGRAMIVEREAIALGLSVEQYKTQQQAISGVSLDEELTNMIKFQQAYNACARTLTTMDEMLSILIERTGVVGR